MAKPFSGLAPRREENMSVMLVCPRCGRPRYSGDDRTTCIICGTDLVNVSHLLRMAEGNLASGKDKMAAFQRRVASDVARLEHRMLRKTA